MDLLRLSLATSALATSALAASSLAACGQAGAEPEVAGGTHRSAIEPPAGWQALPALATAVGAAIHVGGVTVEGTAAWGKPAIGCYATWLALRGAGATAAQVMQGLTDAKLTVHDVVQPAGGGDGLLTLRVERAPYRGQLRVQLTAPTLVMLACFANDREPAACERACTAFLGAFR